MRKTKSQIKKNESYLLWNIFFRCFLFTFSSIYISSEFLLNIGKENWFFISFYVQFFTIVFVGLTPFINRRQFYSFHHIMIFLYGVSLGVYFFFPQMSQVIIAIAVMSFAIDLIGKIVGTNIITKLFTSLQYKRLNSKIIFTSTLSNILGSVLVILTQSFSGSTVFSAVALTALIGHLYNYYRLSSLAVHKKEQNKQKNLLESLHKVKSSYSYAFSNPLIIMAFALIIWSRLVKFFSDWLYVSSASSIFLDSKSLATFLSIAHLSIMGVILLVQKFVSPKIVKKISPSTLLSLIPLSFLTISLVGITFKSTYIGILTNLIFLLIYKSLHMPTLNICLQSIRRDMKGRVLLVLNFLISIFLLMMTSSVSQFKESFDPNNIYFILIILSVIAFCIVTRFDKFYLKNLWNNMNKEDESNLFSNNMEGYLGDQTQQRSYYFNPHHYFITSYEERASINIKRVIQLIKKDPFKDHSKDFENALEKGIEKPFDYLVLIANTYLFSKNLNTFKSSVFAHRNLLESKEPQIKDKGLQLFSLLGTKTFEYQLRKHSEQSAYADKLHKSLVLINESGHQNNVYQNRLKIFASLSWHHVSSSSQEKVIDLLRKDTYQNIIRLSKWLASGKIASIKEDLILAFNFEGDKLNYSNFLDNYFSYNHLKRKEMQIILKEFKLRGNEKNIINKKVMEQLNQKTNVGPEVVLDFLFLVEWLNSSNSDFRFILDSFEQVDDLKGYEKEQWLDFHNEFLKKTNNKKMLKIFQEVMEV